MILGEDKKIGSSHPRKKFNKQIWPPLSHAKGRRAYVCASVCVVCVLCERVCVCVCVVCERVWVCCGCGRMCVCVCVVRACVLWRLIDDMTNEEEGMSFYL